MATTYHCIGNIMTVGGTETIIGAGAATSLAYTSGTYNTVIGAGAASALQTGGSNVIVGYGASASSATGQSTIVGHSAAVNANSTTAKTIVIGNSATTTNTSVCIFGNSSSMMAVQDYGRGHVFYAPMATFNANATLTGANIAGGFIVGTATSSITFYLPSPATLVAAMIDATVGSTCRCFIYNQSASYSITINSSLLTADGKSSYKGRATIGTNSGAYFYFRIYENSGLCVFARSGYLTLTA